MSELKGKRSTCTAATGLEMEKKRNAAKPMKWVHGEIEKPVGKKKGLDGKKNAGQGWVAPPDGGSGKRSGNHKLAMVGGIVGRKRGRYLSRLGKKKGKGFHAKRNTFTMESNTQTVCPTCNLAQK